MNNIGAVDTTIENCGISGRADYTAHFIRRGAVSMYLSLNSIQNIFWFRIINKFVYKTPNDLSSSSICSSLSSMLSVYNVIINKWSYVQGANISNPTK